MWRIEYGMNIQEFCLFNTGRCIIFGIVNELKIHHAFIGISYN